MLIETLILHPNVEVFTFLLPNPSQKMTPRLRKLETKQCLALLSISSSIYRGTPGTSAILDSLCHNYTLLHIETAEVSFV